ncbi:MAG: DUF6712 family protein [Bacteroidota bacterium]
MIDGDTALDQELAIMEDNPDEFALFHDSNQYKDYTTPYFRKTSQFEQLASISGRRAFLALLPYVRKAERELKKMLCGEYANVLTFINAENNDEVQNEMLKLCRSYIATLAMLKGIVQTSMVFIGHKYQLASNTDSYDTRAKMQVTWLGGMEQLKASLQEDLATVSDDIFNLLEGNEEVFPTFAKENQDTEVDGGTYLSDDCIGGIGLF